MLNTRYQLFSSLDQMTASTSLGQVIYCGQPATGLDPARVLQVPLAVLDGGVALCESWEAEPVRHSGSAGDVHFRAGAELLFGWIALNESRFPPLAATSPMQCATQSAYQQIFTTLHQQQFPHLLRVWNFIPGINRIEQGEERYRRFNTHRQRSFRAASRTVEGHVPAATAIGVPGGDLIIYFLAGRNHAATPVENPRQLSAYHYPPEHGRTSPTFSRASILHCGATEALTVSGTASIVGHQTLHAGDVSAQTHELMVNIDAVVDVAGRRQRSAPFRLDELLYKAYVRHAQDLPQIRSALQSYIGANARIVYLQADICRRDLLVEVEACSAQSR